MSEPIRQPEPQRGAQPSPKLDAEADRRLAAWAHIGGVIGFLPSLIIFLGFRERGEITDTESKEALNWQITFTIIWAALAVTVELVNGALLSSPLFPLAYIIGAVPLAWWIFDVFLSIHGGVVVSRGGSYRYPYTFRPIS
jgi:uncharacterized Tic20 family protein